MIYGYLLKSALESSVRAILSENLPEKSGYFREIVPQNPVEHHLLSLRGRVPWQSVKGQRTKTA